MGSINSSSVSVVGKNSRTFRNHDGRRIIHSDSASDGIHVEVAGSDQPEKELGPTDANAFGMYREGRTTTSVVASDEGIPRPLQVAKSNVADLLEVMPHGTPGLTQYAIRHEGNRVVVGTSVSDGIVERISNGE